MKSYKALNNQIYSSGKFSLVPIRFEDKLDIMKWRNEQLYHLRQEKPLTLEDQEKYFNDVISNLFEQEKPNQILFSFLENDICVGYGGLVHINWINKNAEMSFLVNPIIASNIEAYEISFSSFIKLIKKVCFEEIKFNKLYTETYSNRLKHINILEKNGFVLEGILREHIIQNSKFQNSILHSILETEYNAIKK